MGQGHVTDTARRARLVARHHLDATAADADAAVRDLVAVHSSDPATPYLALRARVPGFATADLDAALYDRRTLWRLHAMRRTLFVVAAAEAGTFTAATREVAARERQRLRRWLADELGPGAVEPWLRRAATAVLEALDGERRTAELAERIPELATAITLGSGRWATRAPAGPRLLSVLAMEGAIVRTRPAGSWRSSQYRWARTAAWFGSEPAPVPPAEARAALVRRYLDRYGPATVTDLRWWTGWTARAVAAALAAVGTVTVRLDGGVEGLVLPGDEHPASPAPAGAVTLLPALDPAAMGWKERGWFLGPHAPALFDRNGNAGPTVWLDGRVVGGWAQRADGEVAVRLLEDVGTDAAATVAAAAAAVGAWLAPAVVVPRFRTPLEQELCR